MVTMDTEKLWKIAIILHFSLFCPVVLLIWMTERRFKVFSRKLWAFYPLECWNWFSCLLGCHGNRKTMKNSRYFAFLTHSITTLTWIEGLRCPMSLCIVSKKANASFNQENLEHCICFHDNHQRSTTRSTKYNCHSIFLPFISNPHNL